MTRMRVCVSALNPRVQVSGAVRSGGENADWFLCNFKQAHVQARGKRRFLFLRPRALETKTQRNENVTPPWHTNVPSIFRLFVRFPAQLRRRARRHITAVKHQTMRTHPRDASSTTPAAAAGAERHAYRGVTFDHESKSWRARFYCAGRHVTLGR